MLVLGKPEPEIADPTRRYIEVALRTTEVIIDDVPPPTTHTTRRAITPAFGIARIGFINILAPFPYVTAHVV